MDIQDNCYALNNAENATFKVVPAQKIEYKCIACNTSCNSNSQLEAHLRSSKHHETLNEKHEKHDANNNQCENGMANNYEHENDKKSGDTFMEDKEARLEGLTIFF